MISQRQPDYSDAIQNEREPARRLREAKTRIRDAEAGLREAETRHDEARTRNIRSTGNLEHQVRHEYGRMFAARIAVDCAISAAVRLEGETKGNLNLARGRQTPT